MPTLSSILVVDDEPRSLETLRRTLEEDFEVFTAASAVEGEAVLAREFVHVVVSDQRMPGTSGVEFLRRVREQWPDCIRIILSGYTDAEDIIAGVNEAGIWQYLMKPWHPDQLLLTLKNACALWRLQQENQRLSLELRDTPAELGRRVQVRRNSARQRAGFEQVTRSSGSPLNAVCALAQKVARHDLSVVLHGESGTGKEVLARAIHYASPRGERAFVVENCGALPDTLLEAELFGHKKGAYTGAHEDRIGLFQQADGGTLFLDEIGDTSPAFQVKLLRALQEGEVRPVGGTRPVPVDVRIIAATNRDLEAEVAAGRFRQDLYYRIAGVTLTLPPLRARPQDVPLLVNALLERSALVGRRFTPEAMRRLQAAPWPGNVRQLQNEVLRAVALADGELIGPEILSPNLERGRPGVDPTISTANEPATTERDSADAPEGGSLREQLDRVEAAILREAIRVHGGNKTRMAEALGLTRVGLRMKLERLKLEST
jgi:two-component system response regulator HupR/HoxA